MEGTDTTAPPPIIASGEKAKARDIIAAIRTLQQIEREHRPATADERQTLARFGGFGAVALSLFPDPVTGRYKDAGWQALGDELKSLLTPEEYDSAKRTTFSQFFTSPIVMQAMHRAIRPPRRARQRHRARARLRHRQFHGPGPGGHAVHRRRAGFASPAASPALLHPDADIRIENFPRHEAARGPHRRRDRQPAVRRRAARLPRPEAAAARFLHRQVARRPEARRHPGPGHQPLHARQAERRRPASTWPTRRISWERSACRRTPSSAKARRSSPTSSSCASAAPARQPAHADPEWLDTVGAGHRRCRPAGQPLFLQPPRDGAGRLEPQGHALRRAASASCRNGDLAAQLDAAIARLPERPQAVRSRTPPSRSRPHPPSPRRRPSGTSPRAVSSSATTRSSTRSKAGKACPSSMAAPRSKPTAP